MAQGRPGEATLLFDALLTTVPTYRPALRLVKVAMKSYEGQETAEANLRSTVLKNRAAEDDGSLDLKELTELLEQGNAAEQVAAARANEPNAEEATLAPLVPVVEEEPKP